MFIYIFIYIYIYMFIYIYNYNGSIIIDADVIQNSICIYNHYMYINKYRIDTIG